MVLITFFTFISLNEVLLGYQNIIHLMGNDIYWIVTANILLYLITVLLLSKIGVKYLLSGKYFQFVVIIIVCSLLYLSISYFTYKSYIDGHDLFSETVLIENISAFVLHLLCISGIFIPVFLKNWMIANQQLNELKIKQESSQVEQFKEQINPASFFKVLNRSKSYVKTEPDIASTMLMKFGQLLRYQLYDCNREQVFLNSEISFVRNFMELERLRSPKFDYELSVTGNLNGILVPPSVLLPYVQNVINTFEEGEVDRKIEIRIDILDEAIVVLLKIFGMADSILLQKELLKVRERLNALYKDSYALTVSSDKFAGEMEIMLELTRK